MTPRIDGLRRLALWAALVATAGAARVQAGEEDWSAVQPILARTREVLVLDGTRLAPTRSPRVAAPVRGDWMIRHALSDPENYNPYTSSDAGASSVLGYVFESLLWAENEPPYTLRGRVAKAYPTISPDKLSYTFELRENARFADGAPITSADPAMGYVDRVVFKVINNTDAAFIELTNGNLDYHTLSPLEFKEKSWSPQFVGRFLKGVEYASGYAYIGWNNRHPIFADRRVRRAMGHLTDTGGMIENLLFGLAEPVAGPIHRFRPEYHEGLQPLSYDPEQALALLTEAGWEDRDADGLLERVIDGVATPFRFEILVNSGNQLRKDVALALQHELRDLGVDCQVRELDWSILLQRVRAKEFAAVVLGWTSGVVFPPDGYQVWHSSQAEADGSNYVGYSNPEVDRILEEYRREFDPARRIALYRRFQELVYEDQPYTFLWTLRQAKAYSRRFAGVNWYPAGADLQEWWVGPENQLYR